MTLVVLLRGVNVGGHRTFRPAELAKQLAYLEAVNIGAAGTFVIRKRIAQARLRSELARRLPFETEILICPGSAILELVSSDPFADEPVSRDVTRFVSLLARVPRSAPSLPLALPAKGRWELKFLGRQGRMVFGVYRRHMKAIGHLGTLDRLFGVPVTTRSWSTINAIAKALA